MKPPIVGPHLTEDQIDEILMKIAEPEVAAHAEACAHCGARLQHFREAVGSFNQASMAWSEARSSTMPLLNPPMQSRGGAVLWSYATASVLATALLATALAHHHAVESSMAHQVAAAPASDYFASRQQEIAQDNAMLSAISSELYRPVAIPAALAESASEPQTAAMRRASN